MSNQIPPTEYKVPPVTLVITTYELAQDNSGNDFWKATVSHVFHGETVGRVYQISEAHKLTDTFYKASFEGALPWKGENIYLKNSEPQIIK